MANSKLRLKENVAGELFVDSTCIDCDTCRQIAPEIFRDHGDQSSVFHQPKTKREIFRANMAVVACPTGSIGAAEAHGKHRMMRNYLFVNSYDSCGFYKYKWLSTGKFFWKLKYFECKSYQY